MKSKKPKFFIFSNCNVIRVIDGDTFESDVDLGFGVWIRKQKFRLYGVDTPETRGKRKTAQGIFVKEYVISLLQGKTFEIKCFGKGKYGRWLADVKLPGERLLSHHLVSMGYAKEMKY
jgi:micrococcal nuclease